MDPVLLQNIKDALKDTGVQLFETSGYTVFEIRSEKGEVLNKRVLFFICQKPDAWYRYAVEWNPDETPPLAYFLHRLTDFVGKLNHGLAKTFNPDGGDMGRESDN